MNRNQKLITLLILVFALYACKDSNPEVQETVKTAFPIKINLSVDLSLMPYMEAEQAAFAKANPLVNKKHSVKLNLIPLNGINSVKEMAQGKIKTDLWLSQASAVTDYLNNNIRNLGAPMHECQQLFGTPFIIAATAKTAAEVAGEKPVLNWSSLFDEENENQGNRIWIPASEGSNIDGLMAVFQLGFFAQPSRTENLDLTNKYTLAEIHNFVSKASSYQGAPAWIFDKLTSSDRSSQFVLTSEQQLLNYNKSKNEKLLAALYPEEGSLWMDYSICQTKADWITPEKAAAIKVFYNFIASKDSQIRAGQHGFRPSIQEIPETAPLNPEFGMTLSLPETSLSSPGNNALETVLNIASNLDKPSAVMLIVDTSGSMEGAPLDSAKFYSREMIGRLSEKDELGLISFSRTPRLETKPTTDKNLLYTKLEGTSSKGGSAVYDALQKAGDQLSNEKYHDYNKAIILITDGNDLNSRTSLFAIKDEVTTWTANGIGLHVIAIQTEAGTDFTTLEDLAKSAEGSFKAETLKDLEKAFEHTYLLF